MALDDEITELLKVHKGLRKTQEDKYEITLSGTLFFEAKPDKLPPITENFEIEILIPSIYPNDLPRVRETASKIDSNYEHVFQEGDLCLGVPVEMRRIFSGQPSLLGFVDKLLIPYFYGYCHWKKYGEHPFGEQKHNGEGILQYYVDELNLDDEVIALAFLCFLYEHGYRGHHVCPCGSGRIVRKCHGPILFDIYRHHTSATLHEDMIHMLVYCLEKHESGALSLPDNLLKQIHRILKTNKSKCSKHQPLLPAISG